MIKTLEWTSEGVVMIDQRLLPNQEEYPVFRTYPEVADAIRSMVVRGAPAIGVAAAMGVALGAKSLDADQPAQAFDEALEPVYETLAATRPTAVNLFWAIERMRGVARRARETGATNNAMQELFVAEALRMHDEDI